MTEQIIPILCLTIICFSCFMLVRNNIVARASLKLALQVREASDKDIDAKKPWEWRWYALNLHSYDKKMWQLWKWSWTIEEINDYYFKKQKEANQNDSTRNDSTRDSKLLNG